MASKIEKKFRNWIIKGNPVWGEDDPDIIKLFEQQDSVTERERCLYGEWKHNPLDALILYTKGNRSEMKHIFGSEGVHCVNTRFSDVEDTVLGNRYKEIIVFDDGVEKKDIDLAMKYKWRGE